MQQTKQPWWNTVRASISLFFSRGGEFRRDPRLSWKVIIILFLVGTLAVLVVGYFTYYNATKPGEPEASSGVPRSALRPGDVKVVIETYQQKKEHFTVLLSGRPTFRSPEKGAVVEQKEENPAPSPDASTSPAVLP